MPSKPSDDQGNSSPALPDEGGSYEFKPGTLISFPAEVAKNVVASLEDVAGKTNIAYAADFDNKVRFGDSDAALTVFPGLGVAVADFDPDQETAIAAMQASGESIVKTEPEPIFYAFGQNVPADLAAYLRGYRDAVNHIYDHALGGASSAIGGGEISSQQLADDLQQTWGIIATKVGSTKLTGRGTKIAILDTGLDLTHPDFKTRSVIPESFIRNHSAQDGNGHGTHCAGIAAGPRTPTRGPRYGVAYEADLFIGKVLTDGGAALGRSTIAGIEWAVSKGCHVVSMSLGAKITPGQNYLDAFERVALEALRRNCVLIAAAGNDSRRSQGLTNAVSSPANCPSIMAVGALDRALRVADFSNKAINPNANVDISAPGVEVYSTAPEPAPPVRPPYFRQWSAQYDTLSGTSMATPFVAGIAALMRQEFPDLRADEIWRLLVARATPLNKAPSSDVGAGLVQI